MPRAPVVLLAWCAGARARSPRPLRPARRLHGYLAPESTVNLFTLTIFWSFYCSTAIILADEAARLLDGRSLLDEITASGRAFLTFAAAGTASGFLLEGMAQWLGKLGFTQSYLAARAILRRLVTRPRRIVSAARSLRVPDRRSRSAPRSRRSPPRHPCYGPCSTSKSLALSSDCGRRMPHRSGFERAAPKDLCEYHFHWTSRRTIMAHAVVRRLL